MKSFKIHFALAVVAIALSTAANAMQKVADPSYASKADATKNSAAQPSPQQITDAKSKGLVWVNLNTRVYHKDGVSYGTTKKGKFMTEDDAKKAGYRAAKEPVMKKTALGK